MDEAKVLLHDDEAEKYVVGGILNNQELYWSVADRLKPSLFANERIARTIRCIIEIFKQGDTADIISVSSYMTSHRDFNNPEPWEIAEYSSHYISANFSQCFAIVEELYTRRRYYELGARLMQFGTDPTTSFEEIQKDITLVVEEGAEKKKRVKSLRDANQELKERVQRNYDGTSETMIPTGFKEIDERGGLQTGDFDVIGGESSMGKALAMDEPILTPNGWVENRNLKVGDAVASVDGKPSFVTGIYPQGVKDMYRITFNDGRTAKCSGDHLWEVCGNCAFHGKSRVMSALEIKQWKEKPLVRKATFNIPMFCGEFGERKEFVIHPYILGILIGDGCLTNGTTFVSVDEFIVNKIKELSPLPVKRDVSKNRIDVFRLSHGIKGKKNIIREELRRLGIFRHLSYDKFIPNEYLDCCYEQRLQLLNGLMDSDGSCDKNANIQYSTKSKRLANDVVYLCRSLGLKASCRPHRTILNGKEYSEHYRINIAGANESKVFTLPRKIERTKFRKRTNLGITNIEYIGREECQCIKVSHPRELFIMSDFIVTHNTSLLMTIAENAAQRGVPSMIFSMEMESSQIAARLASHRAKISSGVIQYKKLSDWQMNEVSQAMKQTDELPIYFDDESTISSDSIVASIRMNVRRLGVKLVGIDYLQILSTIGHVKNQEQFLGDVSRKFKNLAKELKICIVALSQLARNINDPKPNLSRLRASGQIGEAADTVMFVWRPSEYGKSYTDFSVDNIQNTAELIFDKGRNIGKYSCIVGFDKETTHFYEYEGEVKRLGEIHTDFKKGKKGEQSLPEVKQGDLPF